MINRTLTVLSPVKGALVPLEQVPDPVFSQKILGEGVAIDPAEGTIVAPFNGTLININPNLHAFVLEHDGVELLVHVGLDTVQLKGKGFLPLAKARDTVTAGQPILLFDVANLQEKLSSALVLCVVTAPSHVHIQPTTREILQAGDPLFHILVQPPENALCPNDTFTKSDLLLIRNEHGLHARPAGVLARLAGEYPHDVFLCNGKQCVNAKSIVSLMSLALHQGDQIFLRVGGPADVAQTFIQRAKQSFSSGFGELDARPNSPKNNTKQ